MNVRGQLWLWGVAAALAAVAYVISMAYADTVTDERLKTMPSVHWGGPLFRLTGSTPSI